MGNYVFLNVTPRRGVVRFGVKGKLAPRYIGHVKILKRIGNEAYSLNLPSMYPCFESIRWNLSMLFNGWECLSNEMLPLRINRFRYIGESSKCWETWKFHLSRFFGSITNKKRPLGSLKMRCWRSIFTYLSFNLIMYFEFLDEILLKRVDYRTPQIHGNKVAI